MGITGYCLEADAIALVNDFQAQQADTTNEIIGKVTAYGQACFNEIAQCFLSMKLAKDSPFNPKIDNFVEKENIENFLISSIEDEEIIDRVCPVGVIQLYNKNASDITQEDMKRIFHIRKLLGSMIVKTEYIQISL